MKNSDVWSLKTAFHHLTACRAGQSLQCDIQISPGMVPLSWCLYKEKRFSEANDWAEKALEQAPDDENIRCLSDMIRKDSGDKEENS